MTSAWLCEAVRLPSRLALGSADLGKQDPRLFSSARTRESTPGTEPRHITFRLTVEAGEGELCMRVWDPDPDPPPRAQPLPDDDAESGRGLFIVNALSSRWGWHPAPNGGKFVWSALRLDARPPDD